MCFLHNFLWRTAQYQERDGILSSNRPSLLCFFSSFSILLNDGYLLVFVSKNAFFIYVRYSFGCSYHFIFCFFKSDFHTFVLKIEDIRQLYIVDPVETSEAGM